MRRPSRPVPAPIRSLNYNPYNHRYEILEGGILYQMQLEHTRLLKEYFRGHEYDTKRSVSGWYEKLDNQTKKEISRQGHNPTKDDFYPDINYE